MGAFCVFGISKTLCKEKAAKKVPTTERATQRELTPAEWAVLRDDLARVLFDQLDKPVKVSPEFDAPQFCFDWLRISPSEVKLARVMARQPKKDEAGKIIHRKGVPVMTWVPYGSEPA